MEKFPFLAFQVPPDSPVRQHHKKGTTIFLILIRHPIFSGNSENRLRGCGQNESRGSVWLKSRLWVDALQREKWYHHIPEPLKAGALKRSSLARMTGNDHAARGSERSWASAHLLGAPKSCHPKKDLWAWQYLCACAIECSPATLPKRLRFSWKAFFAHFLKIFLHFLKKFLDI